MNTFNSTIMVIISMYLNLRSYFAVKFKQLVSAIASGLWMWNRNWLESLENTN